MKATEFRDKIDAYFAGCEDENVFPDEAGLKLALNLTDRAYLAFLSRTDRAGRAFRDALEIARMRRESILGRRQFRDGKGYMFSASASPERATPERADERAAESAPGKDTVEVILRGEEDYFA